MLTAIDINFKLNNQDSLENSSFYLLTSNNLYSAKISPYSFTVDLTIPDNYVMYYILNHNPSTISYDISSSLLLNLLSASSIYPSVCCVSLTLEASGLSATTDLSAIIVPYFLSVGTFEAFPSLYFDNLGNQQILTPSNYRQNSIGVQFYGEGHTETINLTALSSLSIGQSYVWFINGNTTAYPTTAINQNYSTVNIQSSTTGIITKIPIGLLITDYIFLSSSPKYYRDDITGNPIYYPHYISTIDPNGTELQSNTKTFQSIYILPYDIDIKYNFYAGANGKFQLPKTQNLSGDYGIEWFDATLTVSISGESVDTCYGLHDTIWRWEDLDKNNPNNTFVNKPSSWHNTELTATYPKHWGYEASVSATKITPIHKKLVSTKWELQNVSTNWAYSPFTYYYNTTGSENSDNYPYFLQYNNDGTNINTCNLYDSNIINVGANTIITCSLSAQQGTWNTRDVEVDVLGSFTIDSSNLITLYTANRYVLSGTQITFQIVGWNKNTLYYIDDSEHDLITTSTEFYTISYKTLGTKTLKISAQNMSGIDTYKFDSIINVVSEYEATNISDVEYRSEYSPLIIPYPTPPYVAPNDWAVEDNINSIISKMYQNLNYLNIISSVLNSGYTEYYGWLGSTNNTVVTCNTEKTWDGLMCSNTEQILWDDFNCTTGRFSACATYDFLTSSSAQTTQNCLGLYCIPWNWKSLKSTSPTSEVTWGNTKFGKTFAKKWGNDGSCKSSTNDTFEIKSCLDIGQWNVNIQSSRNSDTPIIDDTFEQIRCGFNTSVPCIYTGIASKNNIIYAILSTQIMVLSSDYTATLLSNATTNYYGGFNKFQDLKGIAIDSKGKIFVLDRTLGKVFGMTLDLSSDSPWTIYTEWGGVGGINSTTKFYHPNDIYIDQNDNVYITDTGNHCIKKFTNNGIWTNTCLLYTSPSPRDGLLSRMPSSA